ncbi:hypothetical protein ACOSP7_027034 [Xanthoceras sorbifolium]
MLTSEELETGTGANQIRTLSRPGAARWSSHYSSVNRLIDMFGATCTVLENTMKNELSNNIRGEAKGALQALRSFEFMFILQLMNEVMGITHMLYQALQLKSQDILNALHLVKSTKILLQELKQKGWDSFLYTVLTFCKDQTMELLALSSALDPMNNLESFNIDDICSLAKKFYPIDFTKRELAVLKRQLQHYKNNILVHPKFRNISSTTSQSIRPPKCRLSRPCMGLLLQLSSLMCQALLNYKQWMSIFVILITEATWHLSVTFIHAFTSLGRNNNLPQPENILEHRVVRKGMYQPKTEMVQWKEAPVEDVTWEYLRRLS